MSIHLYHLGDICTPGCIINDILDIKTKTLFMYGEFHLDGINDYLQENKLDEIYDRNLYTISTENSDYFLHAKYHIKLNHDFRHINGEIINYDIVRNRFIEKIKNWETMCNSDEPVVFIHVPLKANSALISRFFNVIKSHKKKGEIYMICLSPDISDALPHSNVVMKQLSDIKCYTPWSYTGTEKISIYEEYYTLFIDSLAELAIPHNFPHLFKETHGGRNR